MQAFEYASPRSREEAVELLAAADAMPLAGGTDLLSLMKDHLLAPRRLVSLKGIAELRSVAHDEKLGLRIGALATLTELAAHAGLQHYPGLRQAIEGIHSPQIQNMGTVGGDLLQRPRCWYYRNGFGLLAMQGGKSLVPEGDNRYHAIFGNEGPAYYVNPSSLAPALLALDARLKLFGPKGEREVPAQAFFKTPRTESEPLWDLAAGEILTEVLVPPAAGRPSATYEVRQRTALDWPLASASVALAADGAGRVSGAKIVLGHVAPVPWPAPEAAALLEGKPVTEQLAAEAGAAAARGARALSRNGYKVRLVQVAVKRAILRALDKEV